MQPTTELQKSRDFGELITDTFVFIKQNLKPLLKCFFIFCGFFILAGAIASAIQQTKFAGVVNNGFIFGARGGFYKQNRFNFLGVEYFVALFFLMLGYTAMPVTVYSFMSLYKEKGNIAPTPQEVWGYFKYFFFKILGSGILLFILLVIAFVFCVIPGIYLYPIFALIFPIMVFENSSFGYAFSKSFRLIKNNWWLTFGCLVIIVMIVYFATMIIILPTTLLNISSLLLHPGAGMHFSAITLVITTVLQHFCMVFAIVPLVTTSLCYFSLAEQAEGTGLIERINKLGTSTSDDTLSNEEY